MHKVKHIYAFNYDPHEHELCKLEARHIFAQEIENKVLFSNISIEPSCSAFIRKRLDIMLSSGDYSDLIQKIKHLDMHIEGFKIEYLVLEGDKTEYAERLEKLRDIGYSIEGIPDYYHPSFTYALCSYKGIWYFGTLKKNNTDWHKHKQKPYTYSSSINPSIAKALVNIAAKGKKDKKLIDACCGVGSIILEACFAGYTIEGCEINQTVYKQAKENLSNFNYKATIHHSDIKNIHQYYDAAIVDLPYNLFCHADDNTLLHIIASAAQIADRLVIVSINDISDMLTQCGLTLTDYCSIGKMGKTKFFRKIWVCEN
ncbi:MAG: methyltransferase [Clostridiales bacterium]|nr:methyltransferase [Clostridiales bacterium]